MQSEIELKPFQHLPRTVRETKQISRVKFLLKDYSNMVISRRTGYHSETVRRYLTQDCKVPADFFSQVALCFDECGHYLLTGEKSVPDENHLRQFSTQQLFAEFSRRLTLIEDCTIGSILNDNLDT